MSLDIDIVRSLATADKIALKRHSILRMRQRSISVDEIRQILISGRIIEGYPSDRPLPSGLLLGFTDTGRAIHAVVAVDGGEPAMLWLITVYEPNLTEWEEGFECRRNR